MMRSARRSASTALSLHANLIFDADTSFVSRLTRQLPESRLNRHGHAVGKLASESGD